jgi:raffinose/stachyose/melibiose transport system permease protein
MRTSRGETVLNYAFLVLLAVVVLVPVAWFVLTGLSPNRAGTIDLTNLSFANFPEAWEQADLGHTLTASAVITVCAVALQAVLAITSGYAFGILGVIGDRLLFPLVLLGLMVSLEALVVPLYYQLHDVGLTDSWLGMVLIHAGTSVPFGTFWMRAVFRAMPVGLVDAARVDGSNSWQLLWHVLMPMARPAVLTLCLLNFMWTWNDYFLSLIFLSSPDKLTATVALGNFQSMYTTSVNLLAAASLMISAPVVLLYLFFQRQFIQGVVSGALKDA